MLLICMLQIYFEKHEILLWQESGGSECESSVNAKVCREAAEPGSPRRYGYAVVTREDPSR